MSDEWVEQIMENTPREQLELQADQERSRLSPVAVTLLVGAFAILVAITALAGLTFNHWKHLIF